MNIKVEFLTKEEEMDLARKGLAGDTDARNRVVMNILPYIIKAANRYAFKVPHDDLVQHALAMCLEKFHLLDLSRGWRPMTYLCHVAERQMQLMTKTDGVIYIPPRNNVANYADETNLAAERAGKLVSLNDRCRDHPDVEIAGALMDVSSPCPVNNAMDSEGYDRFQDRLRVLDKREREIVRMRVIEGKTLEEVGEILGVCKERVRQIQEIAMKKLRRLERSIVPALSPTPCPS